MMHNVTVHGALLPRCMNNGVSTSSYNNLTAFSVRNRLSTAVGDDDDNGKASV